MTYLQPVPDLDHAAADAARERWATRAKPPGALGLVEEMGVQLAAVTGVCPPTVPKRPAIAVFAGDHGVVADGASAWPQEITTAMVATIAGGGAAINAFASQIGASVRVVDVGVANPTDTFADVDQRRVRNGTASIADGPAMTVAEAESAIEVGHAVANELVDDGADSLIGGEMGIGNTTPSAALIAACSGHPVEGLVGPGAGLADSQLAHKAQLVESALAHLPADATPVELLAEVGGLEIAALAGFYIAAAQRQVPFIVDGVISCAALCAADRLAPGTARRAIAGHRSTEPAAKVALDHLGLQALLDLELRLGEGTGAALAFPLLAAAATAMATMADLPTA